jgi:hypothetical protein
MTPFQKAFAKAREDKEKEFEFNGKMYHTRTKEEDAKYKKGDSPEQVKAEAKRGKTLERRQGNSPSQIKAEVERGDMLESREKAKQARSETGRSFAMAGEAMRKPSSTAPPAGKTAVPKPEPRNIPKDAPRKFTGTSAPEKPKRSLMDRFLQREKRGYKAGGMVRGAGCATKGVRKPKMR